MNHLENFTSLPANEERTFIVYEEQMMARSRKAGIVGLVAGAGVLVVIVGIVLGVTPPPKSDKISAEDMQGLSRTKEDKKPETAPTPPPTPAPAATPEAGSAAPAAPAAGSAAPAAAPTGK